MTAAIPGVPAQAALEATLRAIADPIGPHPLLLDDTPGDDQPRPTAAAVLVPIVIGHGEPEVLLTVRHSALRSHPGQISFPGGRVDPVDTDVASTALRETYEEVGIEPGDIRVLGSLAPYLTGTGYSVVPVLGLVPAGYPYRLADDEVAEIFHAPLSFLLDEQRWEVREYEYEGRRRPYFEIWFGRYRIWGATAQMIVSLQERLSRRQAPWLSAQRGS
jgi:8-oxo-dGTP pyrophosphatase MutT (NUDIX family)